MANPNQSTNRREFLSKTTKIAAAGAIASQAAPAFGYHNSVNDTIRVGLVGCGGRGSGAAINACNADSNAKIVALADAFQDRIDSCNKNLTTELKEKMDVPVERQFTGFDCCKNLVEEVDVVILATPPYFRPDHLKACVDAGKHVFVEKPVAVDPPGVRSVMETCEKAKEKGLSIVSGLCWRYDLGVNAVMDRIKSGAIGEIQMIHENYLTGTLWHRGENPAWSDMEYQMRNWLYFTWLSGDHTAEQHIHSIDKGLWLMDDKPPKTCYGSGGRLVRTEKKYGNVYDHFSTVFQWENGVKMFSNCRQMKKCFTDVDDYVVGTNGSAQILKNEVTSGGVKWKFKGKKPSMYDLEHVRFFESIREGKKLNNGEYMCYSTQMSIMAREAAYTGKKLEWDEFWNSDLTLGPKNLKMGPFKPQPVALPGTPRMAEAPA